MLNALLSRGYLPAELPPPFWSDPFGAFAHGNAQFVAQNRPRGQSVAHNIPRAGHARRRLDIPNPPHFAKLADLLSQPPNWQIIQQRTRASPFSLTWPRRDHTGHRAFTYRCTHSQADTFRLWNRAGCRYVLFADIQRYYHSVYTHSIPWVLHTKAWAKANTNAACLGNDADRCLRNSQDGQTIGMPIGPDTSLIIAEVLLAYIDDQLHQNGLANGVRFMDEWEFGFDRIAHAENARAAIEDALAFLELELNPTKVHIVEGPAPLNPDWVTALRSVPLPQQNARVRDLVTLFDTAFELSSSHRTKGVLNWATSRAMSTTFNWAGWRALEPILLQSAASEPGSLPRVLRLICQAGLQGHAHHPARVGETLYTIVEQAAVRSHWSEVAWAIWGHILFSIPLDPAEAGHLAATDDPIVALCALDAHHKGLVSQQDLAAAIQRWSALVQTASLDNRDWLLAYEATVKQWLPVPQNPLAADFHYNAMGQGGVYFYRDAHDATQLMMTNRYSGPEWLTANLGYP